MTATITDQTETIRPTTSAPVSRPTPAPPAAAPTPPTHTSNVAAPADQTKSWLGPLLVLIVGMFMTVLDTSIINVAIPTIQTELGGSTSEVAWVSTAYTLVLGIIVPTTAWLGDRVGLGRLYMVSLIGFAVGSALCGLAWSLPSLIAFRIIQAVPGGILPAITLTMIYRLVPRNRIGSAMGIYGIGVIAAPALGPALGGYLVEFVNWRLIFYINVPVAVLGVVLAMWMLPKFSQLPTYRFDFLGFVTIATGLVAILLAVSYGSDWGWTSTATLGLLIGGALALALYVTIELEAEHPLLNLAVFRSWPYVNSMIILTITSVGMFSTLFYIPVYLQTVLGLPALTAGLVVLPQAVTMAAIVPLAGRLYDKIGPRWLVVTGLLIVAFANHLMTGLTVSTSQGQVIFWTCINAVGLGLAAMSVQSSGLAALDPRLTNSGSAFNNVVQRVASGLGLAALSAMVASQQAQLTADRYGMLSSSHLESLHVTGAQLSEVARLTALQVTTTSITNLFEVTTWITLAGAAVALLLRSGAAPSDGAPRVMAVD